MLQSSSWRHIGIQSQSQLSVPSISPEPSCDVQNQLICLCCASSFTYSLNLYSSAAHLTKSLFFYVLKQKRLFSGRTWSTWNFLRRWFWRSIMRVLTESFSSLCVSWWYTWAVRSWIHPLIKLTCSWGRQNYSKLATEIKGILVFIHPS